MNKDNNSWPYQKFHDANKSSSKSSVIWESRFYEYNNSGKIEKIRYQWEKKKIPQVYYIKSHMIAQHRVIVL